MAKNQIAKKDYSNPEGVIFAFADGENVEVTSSQFPAEIIGRLVQYGIAQKLGDEYAGAEGPEEARTAMTSLIERLQAGEWKQAREGGGGARTTMLAEALSRVTGQDVSDCQEKIAGMEDDAVKALKGHPQVEVELSKIKLERQQAALEKAQAKAAEEGEVPALQF